MKQNPYPITVVVVDDHPCIWEGVVEKINLEKDIQITAQFTSPIKMLKYFQDTGDIPDVIVIDFFMPDVDGIETTRQVSTLYPTAKKITFSAFEDLYTVLQMKKAGCNAYLGKQIVMSEFPAIIREVHRTGRYHGDIFTREERFIIGGARIKGWELSPIEKEYLEILVKDGLTQKELAALMHVSTDSINHYRKSIMKKLRVTNTYQMIAKAVKNNIINFGK